MLSVYNHPNNLAKGQKSQINLQALSLKIISCMKRRSLQANRLLTVIDASGQRVALTRELSLSGIPAPEPTPTTPLRAWSAYAEKGAFT